MEKISFLKFLKTGHFGNLRLGMNREQIKESFGAPDYSDGDQLYETSWVWIYGEFSIFFGTGDQKDVSEHFGLYYILDYGVSEIWCWEGWYPRRGMLTTELSWAGWHPRRHMFTKELLKYLEHHRIAYQEIDGHDPKYLLPSGVYFGKSRGLNSVLFGVDLL